MHRLFCICFTLLCVSVYAQNENAANKLAGWKDVCYDPQIHSIQLFKGDNEQALPVITAGLDEFLTLRFDDLNSERSTLRYTLVHCTADWEPDNLFPTEYMNGFPENYLNEYTHSYRSRIDYTHYELQIPNENVRLKASGNYLLKVYESDAAKPAFVRGFSVIESRTTAALHLRGPAVTGENCLQQIELAVNHPTLEVRNAFRELKVRVEQNGYRLPDTAQPTPTFVETGRTDYTLSDRNWYPGGNEFRFYDTRNLDFSGQNVQRMYRDSQGFVYAMLQADDARESRYFFVRDMNGRYYVDAYRTGNRNTEAEYVTTIFTLRANEPFEGDVYVFGELTNFTLHPAFHMQYNEEQQAYELNTLTKQGLYNYRYVLVDKKGHIDWNAIEGCFAETENAYAVYVYFRSATDRYDRLVGLFSISSGK